MNKITTKRGVFLYLGLFIISVSLLGIELLFTRVAKVSFGEGSQFIVISLAILGIGVGAMVVYFFLNCKKYKYKRNTNLIVNIIFISSLIYLFLIFLPFLVINNLVIDFEAANSFAKNTMHIVKFLFFFASFLLYLVWGICVSLIFSHYSKSVSLVYFSNLTGSAFGGLIAIISMNIFGVPKTLYIIYFFSFIAVILFGFYANLKRKYLILIFLLLILYSFLTPKINLICKTNLDYNPLFSETNSFSQIDTYKIPAISTKKIWPSDYDYSQISKYLISYRIIIDCMGATDFVEYNKNENLEFLLHDPRIIPHLLKNYSNILIIGSGAGIDIARAVLMNPKNIDGVEINPLIIERINKITKPEINIYNEEKVNLYLQEARNFISTSNETYDFIYIPGTKRYGGASVALYAFLENYLFTEEAFESYFSHLTEEGLLAITDNNWFVSKYLKTGRDIMGKLKINPENKIVLIESEMNSLLILKKNNFTDYEKKLMKDAAIRFKSTFKEFKYNGTYFNEDYVKITDDHPFYWSIYNPKDIFSKNLIEPEAFSSAKRGNFPTLTNYFVLFLAILTVYTSFTIIPLAFNKSKAPNKDILPLLIYFSALGIGFITIELVLMQKFVLLLGHPVYSMAVVLSSLLFFSGLGSLITHKSSLHKHNIRSAIFLIVCVILLYIIFFNPIMAKMLQSNLISKIVLVAILVAIPSFFMGMLFPLGIKITEKLSKDLIPWMWGINGLASTLGGVLSMIISLLFGFNTALITGAVFYALAAIIIKD